ncbi:hypothetical protein [Caldibacillus debilis]|uniref:hypothetical protein n=1 Tax=Caldibacillus debilis TaxID=301148 RepID=UPI0023F10E46|nr:hypothetical protein [Caldibacillus debilis]
MFKKEIPISGNVQNMYFDVFLARGKINFWICSNSFRIYSGKLFAKKLSKLHHPSSKIPWNTSVPMKKDLPLPPGKVLPTTEFVAGKAGSRTLRYDDFAVNDTPLSAVNDEWPGHFLKKPVTSDPILPKRPETDPLPLS